MYSFSDLRKNVDVIKREIRANLGKEYRVYFNDPTLNLGQHPSISVGYEAWPIAQGATQPCSGSWNMAI